MANHDDELCVLDAHVDEVAVADCCGAHVLLMPCAAYSLHASLLAAGSGQTLQTCNSALPAVLLIACTLLPS